MLYESPTASYTADLRPEPKPIEAFAPEITMLPMVTAVVFAGVAPVTLVLIDAVAVRPLLSSAFMLPRTKASAAKPVLLLYEAFASPEKGTSAAAAPAKATEAAVARRIADGEADLISLL